MKKVFVTKADFPSSAIELLKKRYEVILNDFYPCINSPSFYKDIKGSHAILCTEKDFITKKILDAAGPQLQIISTASITYDHIDVKLCKNKGILVTNVADIGAEAIAEYTIGLLLSVGRRIIQGSDYLLRKKWNEWTSIGFRGKGLVASVVGFLGMGRIAEEILRMIGYFGVKKCYYHDINYNIEKAKQYEADYLSWEELLKQSDFVIANCILEDSTRKIFNSSTFRMMKRHAVLICIGSEELIDLDDLYHSLTNYGIQGAGMEVIINYREKYDRLCQVNNLVLTPRIESAEITTMTEQANFAAEDITRVLEEGNALALVP